MQDLGLLPSTLDNMNQREKAFVYASIMISKENQKKSGGMGNFKNKGVR